jgi:hypothetical protein
VYRIFKNLQTPLKQILEINKEALEEKYLGLPTTLGNSTKEAFEKICTQVKNTEV